MKPELPFSKLPSLTELLNHPTVQGVVERVNQTTIAQRATGFLEELQIGWKEQGGIPSVGELAERLAQRLLGRPQHSTPRVNATGVLCSQEWQAPMAEAAVHELLRFASDYQQSSVAQMEGVAASLVRLTGAEAAWVASSYEAAVSMTAPCKEAKLVTSPLIGMVNPADFGRERVDTIASQLEEGADLVVCDGSGLLGGPRCGIVVGAKQFIDQMCQSELAPALAAEDMVLAALQATLEAYRDPDKVMHQIPVLQLLSAPLENLQQRCERIAPLLAECEPIEAAEVFQRKSVWLDAGSSQLTADSWAIRLRSAKDSTTRVGHLYQQATPPVVGCAEEEDFVLDFRAIFPRWDQHLVTAISRTN